MGNVYGVSDDFLRIFRRFGGNEQKLKWLLEETKASFLEENPGYIRYFGRPPEEGSERQPRDQMYQVDHYAADASVNLVELADRVVGAWYFLDLKGARTYFRRNQPLHWALGADACEAFARFPELIPEAWKGSRVLFVGDVYRQGRDIWVKALDCTVEHPRVVKYTFNLRRDNYLRGCRVAMLNPPD